MALNLKTLTTRTITAAVFVAVLLACICYNYVSFTGLFFMVAIWGLYEFYQLSEKLGANPYKAIGYIAGICLFCYSIVANSNLNLFYPAGNILPYIFVFIFCVFIVGLFDSAKNTVLNIAYTIAGLVYAVLPFMILVNISCINKTFTLDHQTGNWNDDIAPYNFHYVLGVILLIWSSDVCAYLVGSLIGKHKLYERISPGKTWEGSVGATILTVGSSFIVAHWYPELALKHWIAISIIVCVFGTIGDLVESMLKRQAGVKDSGSIMPGHGGILDRFDSLLFVSPFVYAYLTFIQ
ncbi:MAG: phosphatidate cytidylyltransferase [Bacteroidetes bacterium]|nr:phosphatidate cytidylyltransferase [Bacteroidota bacterium]